MLKKLQFGDIMARAYPEFQENSEYENGKTRITRNFTFQVTDNCNLACTYCYQCNKGKRRMSFETAKKVIDMLLTGEKGMKQYIDFSKSPIIVIDFIGGEPLMEVELIDRIITYFRKRAIELNHPYSRYFRFSMSSNGILYDKPEVQRFLQKNKDVLSFPITVDGTKKLHDSCRLFPDGSPSYDIAHAAALDWMKRGNTLGSKITIAPGNVNELSECFQQMIKDGYDDIHANCVYEKGWEPKHATELYRQVKEFTKIMHEKYDAKKIYISLLEEKAFCPMDEEDNQNWCGGTGSMLAVDPDGYFYPCLRYMESSLGNSQPPLRIGDVNNGILTKPCEQKCVDCLNKITRRSQSTDECFYCPIAKRCSWCSAYNYQEFGTADKRATYICIMHKATALASCYYWNSYYKKHNTGEVMDLWVPRVWAEPIIGKEEYDSLVGLTKSLGGFVNETETMIKNIRKEEK